MSQLHRGLIYCPYTDTVIPEAERELWSWDHVVPLFMGGDDKFQIRSSRRANNEIGSQIEARMQNDFLLSPALRNSGIIGRSGKVTVPEWKHAVVDERKTHIRLEAGGWTFWDKREESYIDVSQRDAVPVSAHIQIDLLAPLRLAAKIALGTLMFSLGESVRHICDLTPFRTIMNMKVWDDFAGIPSKTFRVLMREDEETRAVGSKAFQWKLMVEAFDRTCLILVPHDDGFSFHVAIAGQHVASFQFDANTTNVPRDGIFDIAAVFLLGPGNFEQRSLRSLAPEIMARVELLRAAAEARSDDAADAKGGLAL